MSNFVAPPFAVDGTLLLAADSYLWPVGNGQRDPQSRWAFEYVCTAFCSVHGLHYPQPKGGLKCTPSTLFGLWIKYGRLSPHLGVSAEEHAEVVRRLVPSFRRKLVDDAPQIAAWLSFQFTEEMVPFYIGGGNPAKELPFFASALGPRVGRVWAAELRRSQRDQPLPSFLRDVVYKSGISDQQVATAYAFQAYAKGVTYAWGLAGVAGYPIYRPHWLRESALYNEKLVEKRTEDSLSIGCFPWGMILSKVFDPQNPHEKVDPSRVEHVLMALREYSQLPLNRWVTAREWGASVDLEKVRKEVEAFALDGLRYAGVVPLYKRSRIPTALLSVASDYAKKQIGEVAFHSIVRSVIQMDGIRAVEKVVRALEFAARRRFRVDSVWRIFMDPAVGAAVDAWVGR